MVRREPTVAEDALARSVIGAATAVHRVLGPGFLESVYENALSIELELRGIPFRRQAAIGVMYRDQPVGDARLDLLVANSLIVELKSVDSLLPIHTAQVISYLRATNLRLGLLINFNVPVLKQGIKRLVVS